MKTKKQGVFLDRFGRDITIMPSKKKGWSETRVEVALSDQFFGWIFALGKSVKILGSEKAVHRFQEELEALREEYEC